LVIEFNSSELIFKYEELSLGYKLIIVKMQVGIIEQTKNKTHTWDYINPLLTDLYQITMAYAEWKGKRQDEPCVFEAFFRKNPF
jgi:hypothetical protein